MFNLFRKKDEKKERQIFLLNQLQELKRNNLQLKEIYNKLVKYSIKEYVKEICKTSDKILSECINDNSKVAKLNLFINYYQADVIKILLNYVSIKENKINSEEANEFMVKVEEFIQNVDIAFKNILENLIILNENSIDADIKVMLESLANNKLLGEKND